MTHHVDIERLEKLLGMMGSAHDGEVLVAAKKSASMVRAAGLTWAEIIKPPEPRNGSEPIPHHVTAQRLLRDIKEHLTSFERRFLIGIMSFQKLSEAQEKTLQTIANKASRTMGS